MRRYAFLPLLAAIAAPAVGLVRTASAQQPATPVSDADKKAARDLYFQGVELQQAGKFADALDRFQRAQAVFPAPTHLLRIAECEAALGRLVESAEAYRTLSRATLGPGAPAAFLAAQQQGAAELPQIEPRIPSLKIEVAPAGIKDLAVTIDDQPMSSALVGAARPVNPGSHRIAAVAPGYARTEQTVALKERETKAITLTLEKGGAAPPPYVILTPPTVATPVATAPPPAEYEAGKGEGPSRSGWLLGARGGALIPIGSVYDRAGIGDRSGVGGALAIEGGYRFARIVTVGLSFEGGAFLGPGDPGNIPVGTSLTYDSKTGMGAITAGVISNANGVGLLGEIGFGYRVYAFDLQTDVTKIASKVSETYHGPELVLSGGLFLKASESLRIVPKVSLSLGQFGNLTRSCDPPSTAVCTAIASQLGSVGIANGALHSFLFLGVGMYYGHDNH